MEISEIEHMQKTGPGSLLENMKNEIWQRAFMQYNAIHNTKLQVTCRPCYLKVYLFFKYKKEDDGKQ